MKPTTAAMKTKSTMADRKQLALGETGVLHGVCVRCLGNDRGACSSCAFGDYVYDCNEIACLGYEREAGENVYYEPVNSTIIP